MNNTDANTTRMYSFIAHFNTTNRLKADLLKGKVLETQREIKRLKQEVALYNIQLRNLIGQKLKEEFLSNNTKLPSGSLVQEVNHGYIYTLDENLNFIPLQIEEDE